MVIYLQIYFLAHQFLCLVLGVQTVIFCVFLFFRYLFDIVRCLFVSSLQLVLSLMYIIIFISDYINIFYTAIGNVFFCT